MRIFLAVFLFLLTACGGGGGSSELSIPPAAPRAGLVFGYFGDDAASLAETKDHVGLIFIACWGQSGTPGELGNCAADRMTQARAAGVTRSIVVIDSLVYDGANERADAKERVRALLLALSNANVLRDVWALYPKDEPELSGISDATARQVNADIRAVAAEFGATPKLAVIYGTGSRPGFADYDLVGIDDYGRGTGVLNEYRGLSPGQQWLVVPGGANPWRQDPQPYLDWCYGAPDCAGIIAFLWVDGGDFGNGIRSNGMAPAYRALGLRIRNAL